MTDLDAPDDLMTLDEVLIHLSMGNGFKCRGSTYVMGLLRYKLLQRSLKHYIETGEIMWDAKWGVFVKAKTTGVPQKLRLVRNLEEDEQP